MKICSTCFPTEISNHTEPGGLHQVRRGVDRFYCVCVCFHIILGRECGSVQCSAVPEKMHGRDKYIFRKREEKVPEVFLLVNFVLNNWLVQNSGWQVTSLRGMRSFFFRGNIHVVTIGYFRCFTTHRFFSFACGRSWFLATARSTNNFRKMQQFPELDDREIVWCRLTDWLTDSYRLNLTAPFSFEVMGASLRQGAVGSVCVWKWVVLWENMGMSINPLPYVKKTFEVRLDVINDGHTNHPNCIVLGWWGREFFPTIVT